MKKDIYVVAGRYEEYSSFVIEHLTDQHGGINTIHVSGDILFKDYVKCSYVVRVFDLRGKKNFEVVFVGTWLERRDFEELQNLTEKLRAEGVPMTFWADKEIQA